jgi:glutamate 5-kinase
VKEIIDDVVLLKIGTSTLMEIQKDGSECLDTASFERISKQVLRLKANGCRVIIVSSGAITAGMVETALTSRPAKVTRMHELQRLASIGWRHVLNGWDAALGENTIGELLLTQKELGLSDERQEALLVTHTLLAHGDIPIVNENDAITHEEIEFGDNDTLAATYAARICNSSMFGNNVKLILLSDINGVYSDLKDSDSVISKIQNIDAYSHLAQEHGSKGTGQMRTKFEAARIATENGVEMWIANGRTDNVVERALDGELGTHFTV